MGVNRNYVNIAYGLNNASQSLNPEPIFALRAPTSRDIAPLGTSLIYKVSSTEAEIYILTVGGLWTQLATGSGSGVFSSLEINGASVLNGALTVDSGSDAIAIGTDAVAKAISIGNSTGATSVSISSGTGDITVASSDEVLVDATGVLELNSSAGAISIGNDAVAQAINIGTGAAARTVTVGNTTGATALVFNTGSGGVSIPSFTNTGALVSNASGLITDANASTSGYVLTSNGSGSAPSFQAAASGGMTFTSVTGTTQTMAVSNGYVSNAGASLVTFTLPSTASVGQMVAVQGAGSGLWTIAQNSGQTIHSNGGNSTTGVGGSVSSSGQYDVAYLMCTTANTDWSLHNYVGNLNFV